MLNVSDCSSQLIKSLKRAIEPAVSDITIDWYVPDTMEALLSPNEIAALYPGDRLISYCTLYHIASFRDKKARVEHPFPEWPGFPHLFRATRPICAYLLN